MLDNEHLFNQTQEHELNKSLEGTSTQHMKGVIPVKITDSFVATSNDKPLDYDIEEDDDISCSDSTIEGMNDESTVEEKPSVVPNESRFNAIEYLLGSLESAMNSLKFDKALVIQSQMAGNLNNASNDVLNAITELQDEIKAQIGKYCILKDQILPEIEANLKIGTKKMNKISFYLQSKYPVEYSKGRSKVLENLTEDEEGIFF